MEIIIPQTPEEFKNYYHLRWQVLRQPWNKPIGSEKDEQEESSFHFLLLNDKTASAVCRLQQNSEDEAQLRYMAVSSMEQGKGYGSIILKAAEKKALDLKCTTIVLHARENAVDFYKKNGYSIIEKSYLMWNEIQHYLMKKNI